MTEQRRQALLADVDPEAMTADALASLPTMDKHDLMGNWDAISTDCRLTLDAATSALDS